MRSVIPVIIAFSAILATGASATPSMSRGEQKLGIDYQECMARAARAFQSQGWSNIGAGGAFTLAYRGSEGAYITCNQVGGITIVNIFVASDNPDSGVPGTARQQLQAAMDTAAAPLQQPMRWTWTCCSGAWKGNMTLNVTQQQGSVIFFTGALGPEVNGGTLAGQWNTITGAITFDRDLSSYAGGASQHYDGIVVNEGGRLRMSGQWRGYADDRAAHDWQAVQQ